MSDAVTLVRLDAITIDSSLQPRCDGLDEGHLRSLMGSDPAAWPPVTVVWDGERFILIDGSHRCEARRRLGGDSIEAMVVEAPADGDLFRMAFELNAAHGKPLTLRDRKGYAEILLRANPTMSDREVGRRTGLNHETVAALRNGDSSGATRNPNPERKPGEIAIDIGLFDPIRRSKATRQQKAVAGYIARLLDALEDPYPDEDGVDGLDGWREDPAAIAEACFAAMGPARASNILETMEQDARFLLQVAKARTSLRASA